MVLSHYPYRGAPNLYICTLRFLNHKSVMEDSIAQSSSHPRTRFHPCNGRSVSRIASSTSPRPCCHKRYSLVPCDPVEGSYVYHYRLNINM